jgi:hypothetical protein
LQGGKGYLIRDFAGYFHVGMKIVLLDEVTLYEIAPRLGFIVLESNNLDGRCIFEQAQKRSGRDP